jgi:hypothetical protein
MIRNLKLTTGALLTLLGGGLLAWNLFAAVLHLPEPAPWRLWPLAIAGLGLLFVLPPLVAPGQRSLGALFVPGLPLLAVAGLAVATLVFQPGFVWGHFWPQIVLALALALGLLALYLRSVWLVVPALILGLLGVALQFSALTGWWSVWAVLWTVVPLGAGLGLLIAGLWHRSSGLRVAGLLVCLFSAIAAASLSALLTQHWSLINVALALGLMAGGAALALWGRPGGAEQVAAIADR